jgi:hypothetical protein
MANEEASMPIRTKMNEKRIAGGIARGAMTAW